MSAHEASSVFGVLVEFDDVDALLGAAERVRDEGFTRWDVHAPFPIHGLDDAMGIRPSRLPWVVLTAGTIGAAGALLLQWWTNAVDYEFLISGKPMFSLPANIPIIFELTVLLAAFAAFLGMLGFSRLPQLYHPVFTSSRFARASCDRFFITLESADPKYDAQQTPTFARSLGGTHVELLTEED